MTVSLCNVTFQYPGRTLFRDMSVTLSPGAVHWIAGPNGSGKSTFLKMLCGYLLPSGGEILLNGRNLSDIPDRVRAGMVGVLPQIPLYALDFTVEETIRIGCSAKLPRFAPIPEAFRKKMEEAIEYFGLKKLRNVPVNRLSGGERQKAALASVYALSPDILLLDEPFSALDYQTRLSVSDEIGTIIRKEGKTAILVTHDISEAICLADKVFVLTKRPATVKKVFTIQLSVDAYTPMKAREAPEFKDYFNAIWKELDVHV